MGKTLIFRVSTIGKVLVSLHLKMLFEESIFFFQALFHFWFIDTRESEYAAWTLVNGHALNHVTISTHRLKTHLRDIKNLNKFLEENGFKLNSEGGVLKGMYLCLLLCKYKILWILSNQS